MLTFILPDFINEQQADEIGEDLAICVVKRMAEKNTHTKKCKNRHIKICLRY